MILIGTVEFAEAQRIVAKLGHLPLAIDQAGAHLNRRSEPLHAYLPLFEANFERTASWKPPSAVWQYGERTVSTTWKISFDAIQAEDPVAAQVLHLCSFFSHEDISMDLLYRGLPELFSESEQCEERKRSEVRC
jgi:hypothetical protein